MGDFNINLLAYDKSTYGLFQIRKEFNMRQLIYGPTYHGNRLNVHNESCLDHIYVNSSQYYKKCDHFPFAGSDHHLTFTTRKVNRMLPRGRNILYRPYAKLDMESLTKQIEKTDFTYLTNNEVQSNTSRFSTDLLSILSDHIPLKQRIVKPTPPRWFSAEIAKLCKFRDSLKSLASILKSAESWSQYKKARNHVTSKIRSAKKLYFKSAFKNECKSKSVWRNVNQITNYKADSSHIVSSLLDRTSGMLTDSPVQISALFASSFCVTPITHENDSKTANVIKSHVTKTHDVIKPITSFSKVTSSDVQEAISHLKNKGGPGTNYVPMKFFKMCADKLSTPLSALFTTIFILCNVPQCFKIASVIPLHKGKGSHTEPNNYRPISILPPIVKIFERIIFMKLFPLVESKFINEQHGYRASRSCQTALTLFTQAIYNYIDGRNCRAGAVFIDLNKSIQFRES